MSSDTTDPPATTQAGHAVRPAGRDGRGRRLVRPGTAATLLVLAVALLAALVAAVSLGTVTIGVGTVWGDLAAHLGGTTTGTDP